MADLISKDFQPRKPGRLTLLAAFGAALAVLALAAGLVLARAAFLRKQTDRLALEVNKGPRVLVATLHGSPTQRVLEIPGSTAGFNQTSVYAKLPGYLKDIRVDKGDVVKSGQIIATLESPETDKQAAQAQAAYALAELTDRRYQTLLKRGVVAQQDADNAHSTMLQAHATYQQIAALQAYETIRAPFDGIVTARYVDPGALVPQMISGAAPPNPIVTLATRRPLRVYTQVPQSAALFMHDGDRAVVSVSELPQKDFSGTITRHPQALDTDTRTMLVEVDLPNEELQLYPGMYAKVRFTVTVPVQVPLAPDTALVFKGGKSYLPLVANGHLRLAPVILGRDDGVLVEIVSGASAGDLVAVNTGQSAQDGEPVQAVMTSHK